MNNKENDKNIFKTQKIESIFSNHLKSNNESWFTRDGRKENSFSYTKEEELFKEHISKLKIQKPNIKEINNIEFTVSYVSSKTLKRDEMTLKNSEPKEFKNFNGIPKQLWENICKLQFQYLTPIQKEVIPFMQNGKDVVACAETGSGKTIAYLFPLIGNMLVKGTPKNPFLNNDENKLNENNILCYPLSLILVPTRELAIQIDKESKKMCFKTGIRSVCVYGGIDKKKQILELKKGCDILIGTPGRLIDLLKDNYISLKMISSLILDEGDRMLDMGFKPQLDEIINKNMPDKFHRQNLLFSATFANEVQDIAKNYLKDFYFIQPKIQSPKQIEQEFLYLEKSNKNNMLIKLIKKNLGKYLIFVSTRKGVDELGDFLYNSQFNVSCIHGEKNQIQRKYAIENFTNGKTLILVATDVAGRGLDFTKVDVVINYDMTTNIEDYIHRIGRTGRIGQKGKAITFIDYSDTPIFRKLVKYLESQSQLIPSWLSDLGDDDKKYYLKEDNLKYNIKCWNEYILREKENNLDSNSNDKSLNFNCDNEENNNNSNLNHKRNRSKNKWFKLSY